MPRLIRFAQVGLLSLAVLSGGPADPACSGAPLPPTPRDEPARERDLPPTVPPAQIPPPPPDAPPEDGAIVPNDFKFTTDQAIQLFKNKVAAHPDDFQSLRYLGSLYVRKAEQSGDIAPFADAEHAFRAVLKYFPDDPKVEVELAGVLCSRHRFVEGLALARKVLASDPKNIDALAILSDALLEIGHYDEGGDALARLRALAPVPEVLARQANLAELKGDPDGAARLMAEAADRVRSAGRPGADAWYVGLLGDFALNAGRIDDAERYYKEVPAGVDPFHDATFGLARVAYARGEVDHAIDLAKKAVAIGPDAHMLAYLGDLLVEAGRPDEAKAYHDRVLDVTADDSERRRPLSRFLADHDRDLTRALELARKDHDERQDVFGDDNLAWALFKNGKLDEAAKAIDDALRLGTKDVNIYYHAGLIRSARGEPDRARVLLGKALAVNPRFAPLHAARARAALDAIGADARP